MESAGGPGNSKVVAPPAFPLQSVRSLLSSSSRFASHATSWIYSRATFSFLGAGSDAPSALDASLVIYLGTALLAVETTRAVRSVHAQVNKYCAEQRVFNAPIASAANMKAALEGTATTEGGEEGASEDLSRGDSEDAQAAEAAGNRATPAVLVQYWAQIERTILLAPRLPLPASLPARTVAFEPGEEVWREKNKDVVEEGDTHKANRDEGEGDGAEQSAGGRKHTPTWQDLAPYKSTSVSLVFSFFSSRYREKGRRLLENVGDASAGGCGSNGFCLPVRGCFLYMQLPFTSRNMLSRRGSSRGLSGISPLPTSQSTESDMASGVSGMKRGPLWLVPDPLTDYEVSHTWEAIFLVWTGSVDVNLNIREVRKLLIEATPPAFSARLVGSPERGPSTEDYASVCLAMMWYCVQLKAVYQSLVVHEDVERCESELEELRTYASTLFRKCIPRWPDAERMSALTPYALSSRQVVCFVRGCWAALSAVHAELVSLRARMSIRSVYSLAKYMYASSGSKYAAAGLIAVLTTLLSRVSSIGRVARGYINDAVNMHIDGPADTADTDSGSPTDTSLTASPHIITLCLFELLRFTLNYALQKTTNEFISFTAASRSEAVTRQLYEAFANTPLDFFDYHTYDEVEQILYYVGDMEGVDVQVHQYVFDAADALWSLYGSISQLKHSAAMSDEGSQAGGGSTGSRALMLAVATVMLPQCIRGVSGFVQRRYQMLLREGYLQWISPPRLADCEEEDDEQGNDGGFGGEGLLLKGMEIIALVHQLRPYGADRRLVRAWNQYSQAKYRRAVNFMDGGDGTDAGSRHHHTNGEAPAASSISGQRWHGGEADEEQDERYIWNNIRLLLSLPHGKVIPGVGNALLSMAEWLLPLIATSYGAKWCRLNGLGVFALQDSIDAVERGLGVVTDGYDLIGMVLANAYKAAVLERVLDRASWEGSSHGGRPVVVVGSTEDRSTRLPNSPKAQRALALEAKAEDDAAAVAEAPVHSDMGDVAVSEHDGKKRLTMTSAATTRVDYTSENFYAYMVATAIHIEHLQYRYASAPTVSVFSRPLNFTLQLRDAGGKGRFICISGPASSGRSTLLTLLLGLYTCYPADHPNARITFDFAARGRPAWWSWAAARRLRRRQRRMELDPRGQRRLRFDSEDALHSVFSSRRDFGLLGSAPLSPLGPSHEDDRNGAFYSSRIDLQRGVSYGALQDVPSPGEHDAEEDPDDVADELEKNEQALLPLTMPSVDLGLIPVDILRRRLFSYVPEHPTLISGATIAQNIALTSQAALARAATLARVEQCAELAQCLFVADFPLGVMTRVCDTAPGWGGGGAGSAGSRSSVRLNADQLQRLMIARALFHGGDVLLLDEPTVGVNADTVTALGETWRRLLKHGILKGVVCVTQEPLLHALADETIALE